MPTSTVIISQKRKGGQDLLEETGVKRYRHKIAACHKETVTAIEDTNTPLFHLLLLLGLLCINNDEEVTASPAFALQWAAASEGLASPGSCLWHSQHGQAPDLTALDYTTALHLPPS